MSLISPVAGPYTATFDPPGSSIAASSIGIMEQGYEITVRRLSDPIDQTDAYGKTPIDAVYMGLIVRTSGVALEYAKGTSGSTQALLASLFPQSASSDGTGQFQTGTNSMKLGQVGTLDSAAWGTLVLTAVTWNSTPVATSPVTLTSTTNVILSPNFDVKFLAGPAHRKIPWEFQHFPYLSTVNIFFSTT